ncbi:spore germination protein KA [Pontibacillus halophilus JSM 076056 = DSM 19796]|uniref:Spore germination protein KA n=1 Tax=Pontibacillus halophilus JSM 076056 = DSM 19796 TaxID=1385510 RepID=A0A0A5GNA2_9BACI|nr:spore germination protein GerPB [Pontibacillus halophilus]KGX92640.1 spore germination protein KA [Pontibacillus halophilus JSM 076056 = DSM 19796]
MGYTIYQNICINVLRVGSITNSSVLQVGSAGVIQARSSLYNTGGFTQPAEEAEAMGATSQQGQEEPLVPLLTPL